MTPQDLGKVKNYLLKWESEIALIASAGLQELQFSVLSSDLEISQLNVSKEEM